MGQDYAVRFKEPIKYNATTSDEFTPFSRGLSVFIGNHIHGSDSILIRIEKLLRIELQFITKPNLYDYKVDELQLEFSDGDESARLIKKYKKSSIKNPMKHGIK